MSCDLLTAKHLELLAAGTLPVDARAHLAAHLAAPCDVCEARLGELAPHALLSVLGGGQTVLTAQERRQLEANALSVVPKPRRRLTVALGLCALAAVAGALAIVVVHPDAVTSHARLLKGAPTGLVRWQAWVGVRSPAGPLLSRPFESGASLSSGELVVLRVALERASRVQVIAAAPGRPLEVLWSGDLAAGINDLTNSERATVAFDPAATTGDSRLWVIASPTVIEVSAALLDNPSKLCSTCSLDSIEVHSK